MNPKERAINQRLTYRVADIINSQGPITRASALYRYEGTRQHAINEGVSVEKHDRQIKSFEELTQ